MTSIQAFLKNSLKLISQTSHKSLASIKESIRSCDDQNQFMQEQNIQTFNKTFYPNSNHQQNYEIGNSSQTVLQIDVIQSRYVQKNGENQQSQNGSINSKNQSQNKFKKNSDREKQAEKQKNKVRVKQIEAQKKLIVQQLLKLNKQIQGLKGSRLQDSDLKRKKMEQQEMANRQARSLVRKYQQQKKKNQQRKRVQSQKQLQNAKLQALIRKKSRDELVAMMKQQKRRKIELRLDQQRKRREERVVLDRQSNQLVLKLCKQEQIMKQRLKIVRQGQAMIQKQELSEKQQNRVKGKLEDRKQQPIYKQIDDHQRKYIMMKEKIKEQKLEKIRCSSVERPIARYQKNRWAQMIQEQQFRKKEQQKMKEISKKMQAQKRSKYSQLVKNIFMPKKKDDMSNDKKQVLKPFTPDTQQRLPMIPQTEKRTNQTRSFRRKTQHTNSSKPPKYPSKQVQQIQNTTQQKKAIKLKQIQIRKQTKQRLRKIQNKSLQIPAQQLPPSKPKYLNYLGQVKAKRPQGDSWKKIMSSDKLSREEKYDAMLRRANDMQNMAKRKEDTNNQDDQSINLYIGSIQAKLALLQKF